ncbi:MAG TPA: four helix bundle protein [Bacteroidales bacterium]|nr:four helix bundle protein [Bacteroidales bacterium]
MKSHKDLDVWKDSIFFVRQVYLATAAFPKAEMFSLTNQIRRAAVSIPANISEGSARRTTRDMRYFLTVSYASLNELDTLLIISLELGYLSQDEFNVLNSKIKRLNAQLSGLLKALNNKIIANRERT